MQGYHESYWTADIASADNKAVLNEFKQRHVGFNLLGSLSVTNHMLSTEVTIQLNERHRVAAIQLSNQPGGNYDSLFGAGSGYSYGGDGTALVMDFNTSAFQDVGLVGNNKSYGVPVIEGLTQHNRFLQVQKFITVLGMYDFLQVKLSTSHRMDSSI